MKTPEEIKMGLECHGFKEAHFHKHCSDCAYHGKKLTPCRIAVHEDALKYIKLLEERIDLIMIQLRGDCGTCKHRRMEYTCRVCCDDEYAYHPLWEYEGFPGERKDDHEKPV